MSSHSGNERPPSDPPSNRLAGSNSPYLLLHKHNPVDWYPWGDEALARSRDEDRPIFLSVGYSTCYWCHVMERESFSDEGIAALMNGLFVNVKLDREERPDLDEIYMAATQILTGHGGWPNSVFLTPKLEPFFAGTYFPPADRPGMPGFPTVLKSMADAWQERRDDVEAQAGSVAGAVRQHLSAGGHAVEESGDEGGVADRAPAPSAEPADRSLAALKRSFDPQWGGFGGAPKFPTPSNLFLLLDFADEDSEAAAVLDATLDQMARGGIYDQLGGGFHRYATDREWKVPHFEKMLYDNGLLLELYARHWRRTGDAQSARIVRETAAFLAREMTDPGGAFWSALDAETDGHEGKFYVWGRDELRKILGEEDFGFAAPLYGFQGAPFFEGSHYVLHLPERLDAQAERRRLSEEDLLAELEPTRKRLFDARAERDRPLTDDKILVDWNGTAIAGLAVAGRLLEDDGLVRQAEAAASFILETLRSRSGTLLHSWRRREGDPAAAKPANEIEAFLADYAFFVRGLLALHEATGDGRWLDAAEELTREQVERLSDPAGGFFSTADRADVLVRGKDLYDGAMPSANAVAVHNLLDLSVAGGSADQWTGLAREALGAAMPVVEKVPEAARTLARAARRWVLDGGPVGLRADATEAEANQAQPDEIEASATDGAQAPPDEAGPAGARAAEDEAASKVEISASVGPPDSEGWQALALSLNIAQGWHVYSAYDDGDAPDWVQPTEVTVAGLEVAGLRFPPGRELAEMLGRDRVAIWEGRVEISGRVRSDGSGEAARIEVRYQVCDDSRCLAPAMAEIEPWAAD